MAHFNFNKDILDGRKGEQLIKNNLQSMGGKFVCWNVNNNNTHDLVMDMPIRNSNEFKRVTYEVKTDVLCQPHTDTGNMFIEFKSRDKDSGIMVSLADWFVYYYIHLGEIYYIKSNKLRELLINGDFEIKSGGDNGTSLAYLIPRYQFKPHFKFKSVKSLKIGELSDIELE